MKALLLPAIHGKMGDRPYYSVVIPLAEVSRRVSYAEEIHDSKELSDFIQRRLNTARATQISDYLTNNSERFFSSLVIAVYGGDPLWYDAGEIEFSEAVDPKPTLPEDLSDRIGFLYLTGNEKLFALDGQHRLAGIRKAVAKDDDVASDLVSAIFVGHTDTDAGKVRTRRLFTVLNKHAKPVKPADIIALDEDDAAAIITRRLVKKGGLFGGNTVSFTATNSLSNDDRASLITIVALYDAVRLIVEKMPHTHREQIKKAKKNCERPTVAQLDGSFRVVEGFFRQMIAAFGDLTEYFEMAPDERRVSNKRTRRGGNVLFRPVGFIVFVRLITELVTSGKTIKQAFREASRLPISLVHDPYRLVLWRPESQTMNVRRKGVVFDLLRLAVGLAVTES